MINFKEMIEYYIKLINNLYNEEFTAFDRSFVGAEEIIEKYYQISNDEWQDKEPVYGLLSFDLDSYIKLKIENFECQYPILSLYCIGNMIYNEISSLSVSEGLYNQLYNQLYNLFEEI